MTSMTGTWERVIEIVLTVVLLIYLLANLIRGKYSVFDEKARFDERQLVARGKAFQAGFYAMLLGGGAGICGQVIWPDAIPSLAWQCGALLLGVGVFFLTAICKDAYLGLHSVPVRWMVLFFVVGGMSLLRGGMNLYYGEEVWLGWLELAFAVLFLAVALALLLHQRHVEGDWDDP
jgi:hypothetical protein